MPGKRLSMRKIKEVLRLRFKVGLSQEMIARSCSMGRTTVREYLQRAARAGVSWPLPEGMTDGALEALRREFAGLRTGRASIHLLEPITVQAYGAATPINQVGTIAVPEQPWAQIRALAQRLGVA